MSISLLPLPCKVSPITNTEVGVDVGVYRAGEAEDRANRDPRQERRKVSITYMYLSKAEVNLVEDAFRNSKGVDRFSWLYAGLSGCYRLEEGYSVSYEKLGATITATLTECSCPHQSLSLDEGIYWDKPATYWDNNEVWD
jgi:hypothetical protein